MDAPQKLTELLGNFKNIPNEDIKEFVMKPRLNKLSDEKMDSYLQYRTNEDDPRLKEIRTNRKKETDYWRYRYKLDLYNSYMEDLVEKYGSLEMVLDMDETGTLDEFVPVMPKLKMNKRNRMIMKLGILPPVKGCEFNAHAFIQDLPPVKKEDLDKIPDYPDLNPQMSDDEKEIFEEACNKMIVNDRISRLKSGGNFMSSDTNFIAEYAMRRLGRSKKEEDFNVFNELRKAEDLESTPDIILAERERLKAGRLQFNGSVYVDSQSNEEVEFYSSLVSCGYSPRESDMMISGDTMKNISKSALKVIRNSIGTDAMSEMNSFKKMSKKESKRLKKERKRALKEQARYTGSSGSISSLISANRFNMSNMELPMLAHYAQGKYGGKK